MMTEMLSLSQEEVRLGIVDSQISSIRCRSVVRTAARAYQDGNIGIASAVGEVDAGVLADQARQTLRFPIAYPPPAGGASSETRRPGTWRDTDEMVSLTEDILSQMRRDFPGFIFSNSASCSRLTESVRDDRGRQLRHTHVSTQVGLVVKERGSPNIFDTFVGAAHPELTVGGFIEESRTHMAAFQVPAEPPPARADGKLRVVFRGLQGALAGPFRRDMVARPYATGASMFDGRLGEQVFSERFTLQDSRDWRAHLCSPFDREGTLRAALNCPLVEDGVLRRVASSRRDAARYGLEATGSAVGSIDKPPVSGIQSLSLRPTSPDLASLLEGEPGLLVWVEVGGDVTRTGEVGTVAMVMLRLDPDGRPVGRVAPGTLTGNLFEIFGEDFVGVTEQTVGQFDAERYLVTHMALR